MTRKAIALWGGALGLLLFLAFGVWAQVNITNNGLFGNEFLEVQQGTGGPGGSSVFTTTGRISNGRSYAYFTTFPNASFTIGANPVAQTTVNSSGMVTGGDLVFNVTNGSAITITMPATVGLIDGEIIGICNVTAAAWATNAVTVAANTGQSFVGTNIQTLTTLAASTCNRWFWNGPAATWFTAGAAGAM
jgi:hypothetical protein